MTDNQSLAHTKWECKYHVVWIPKYRKKKLFGEIRKELGPVLRELAQHKECEILEGKMMIDHIHMLIAIPPTYAVSQVIGYLKGKSAIHIARNYGGDGRTLRENTSGHAATMFQPLVWARWQSGATSSNRTMKIDGLTNCACLNSSLA